MKNHSSRRNFLATGLVLPAAALVNPATAGLQAAGAGTQASSGGLRYRVLGKTGLKVTTVGFGCMITSDQSVIEKAADLGVNYFDTARRYQGGNNERMVGAALKGRRKDIVLSSKSGATKKEEALSDLETSLKELSTDYLDIWYLHAKSKPEDVTAEWLEAQAQAKKQGKIRFSGVSTHGGQPELIPGLVEKAGQIDVVLTSYNFAMDPGMDPLISAAAKAGMGVVAMKVMAGGFRRARPGDKTHETLQRDGAMLAALKWVIKNPEVHTTIPSITDMDQLDEDLKGMSSDFTPADQKILTAQLDFIRPLYCRMCGSCSGVCPQGLPVADMLRYLSYAEGYGDFRLARESFLDLPEKLRTVSCNLCPTCSIQCPNGVQVRQRVTRTQEIFA
jgi:uncharacterized protein